MSPLHPLNPPAWEYSWGILSRKELCPVPYIFWPCSLTYITKGLLALKHPGRTTCKALWQPSSPGKHPATSNCTLSGGHHFLAHSSAWIPLGPTGTRDNKWLKASARKQLTRVRALWHYQSPDSLLKQTPDSLQQLIHKKWVYIQSYEDARGLWRRND